MKNSHLNRTPLYVLTFAMTINLTRDGGVWELPWIFVEVDVIDKVVEGLVRWRNLSFVARYI